MYLSDAAASMALASIWRVTEVCLQGLSQALCHGTLHCLTAVSWHRLQLGQQHTVLTTPRLQAFDELHLLKRGGKTIYAGPTGMESAELISYFEAIPGVPHIQPGMNPATWMLGEPPHSALQMPV